MTQSHIKNTVSRRTALAGLGAGGLGVALTARHASAQDTPEPELYPLVGLWQEVAGGPDSVAMPWLFTLFHADGTYQSWNGLDSGAALGIWRATGGHDVELLCIYQDTDPTTATEVPGTATFRIMLTLDGDTLSGSGSLDVRDPNGAELFQLAEFPWMATRITFDRNPAMGSTITGTPTAGTPTS